MVPFKQGLELGNLSVSQPANNYPVPLCAHPELGMGSRAVWGDTQRLLFGETLLVKGGQEHEAKCATASNSHKSSGRRDSRGMGGKGGHPTGGGLPMVGSAPAEDGHVCGRTSPITLSFTLSRRGTDGHRLADRQLLLCG